MYNSKIKVLIIAPNKTYYNGEAYGLTSENDVGEFDVLQSHTAFISIIKKRVIVRKTPTEKLEIPINRGIITVKENEVKVYIGL